MEKNRTKILLDSGDPAETLAMIALLGGIDGQTTNPSLIAKSPSIKARLASGHLLTVEEQKSEYKKVVQLVAPLVGDAGVSIEVFADIDTSGEDLFAEGEEMYEWIPNAYIKYPCTPGGLRAAQLSAQRNMRVNMTLCFSQKQAPAVYAATMGAQTPIYLSPFVGRLEDVGESGIDLLRSIKRLYQDGDGHVQVLAASLRSVSHLIAAIKAGVELMTIPAPVLRAWSAQGLPTDLPPGQNGPTVTDQPLHAVPFEQLDLRQDWQFFDISHPLTTSGIHKFVADYKNTVALRT